MNMDTAIYWLQEMITTIVVLAAPVLVGALVVGLTIAILQAATSIQEMTLSYIPKMVVVIVILFFTFGFMLQYAVDFMQRIFEFVPQISN